MKLDVLAFAAHPDDVEMGMGGTAAKFCKEGYKFGIVDFTGGELGTRGNPELRRKEAQAASEILGVTVRENLKRMDGEVKPDMDYVLDVVRMMRKYKPEIVYATYFNDRHPDHIGCATIVKEAMFYSGLPKIETFEGGVKQEAYRPKKLYYYMMSYEFKPSFIVDISDYFDLKMKSVEAYKSQIYNPESNEPETFISKPEFYKIFEARARHFGFLIRKEFGEAFFCEEDIEMDLRVLLEC